jgi:LysM repeat protein
MYPGAVSGCQEYYTVQAGDYCDLVDQKFSISLSQLTSWNSGLDAACSNLWLGYQYCVKA